MAPQLIDRSEEVQQRTAARSILSIAVMDTLSLWRSNARVRREATMPRGLRSRTRRTFIGVGAARCFLSAAASTLPVAASVAQISGEMRRIGYVNLGSKPPPDDPGLAWYRSKVDPVLLSHGWERGRQVEGVILYADNAAERVPALYEELVRRRVDVLTAFSTSHAVAAVRATTTIPIVMFGAAAFPVECGLIQSFARPGGNVTGVAFFQGIEVQSKLAQFVRDILPRARRLAWIAIPPDLVTVAGGEFRPQPYYAAVAQRLGFDLGYYECRKAEDFDTAFAAMRGWGAEAVIVDPSGLSATRADTRERIAKLALQSGLPSMFGATGNVFSGGLLTYAPDEGELYAQAAGYVGRILNGARAAELPVEMPRVLRLIVNQRTAKALGIKLPRSILTRVDQMIE